MNITCETETPAGVGPCPIDNPTPLSLDNGTTLLAHRAKGGFGTHSLYSTLNFSLIVWNFATTFVKLTGMLIAPHWAGPYRNVADGLGLNGTNIPVPDDEYSCE